jgi:hypothetical protein
MMDAHYMDGKSFLVKKNFYFQQCGNKFFSSKNMKNLKFVWINDLGAREYFEYLR